jgi:HAD superfamily hydrolase (TIGR01509 family)
MNPPPELIIFDCDGVLIDSEVLANRANVEFLSRLGITVTLEDYMQQFVGLSRREELEVLERHYAVQFPDDYEEALSRYKQALFERELKATPGIDDLLQRFSLPKAVASGSSPERLEHTLNLTGLWSLFDPHIYSTSLVAKGKPAPDIYLYTADKLGVLPERCLVIEDSVPGVQAAVAAGMTVVGFTGGSHIRPEHDQKLLSCGAREAFDTMPALAEWLVAACTA